MEMGNKKVENLIHLELAKSNPEGWREWRIPTISRSGDAKFEPEQDETSR